MSVAKIAGVAGINVLAAVGGFYASVRGTAECTDKASFGEVATNILTGKFSEIDQRISEPCSTFNQMQSTAISPKDRKALEALAGQTGPVQQAATLAQ